MCNPQVPPFAKKNFSFLIPFLGSIKEFWGCRARDLGTASRLFVPRELISTHSVFVTIRGILLGSASEPIRKGHEYELVDLEEMTTGF